MESKVFAFALKAVVWSSASQLRVHSEKHPGILLNGDNESTGVEGHLRGWSPDNLPRDHDDESHLEQQAHKEGQKMQFY